MNSASTIQLFIKLSLLPLAKDKDGQPKVNLANKGYLLINLFRILPLTVYLYFSINDLLSDDLNMKSGISFSVRAVGYIGGSGLAVFLAITGQRLGPNSLMVECESLCWQNVALIGVMGSLYALGSLITDIPIFNRLTDWNDILPLSFALAVNILFINLDYGATGFTCFLWVKDLKTKLQLILLEKNTSTERFEEILQDYLKLRYSMELLGAFIFPLCQVLAISSAYLGFTAGY